MSTYRASPLGKLRTAVIICCLILILGIFGYAYLSDRNDSVLAKDEILQNISELGDNDYGYKYVSSYAKKYGIGNVNTYKLNNIETYLEDDFYKELPKENELAKAAALLFVEHFYDTTDLDDKEAVTDAYIKCLFASIGDPYAYYRTADEFLQYTEELSGGSDFVGIGVMMNSETLEIMTVYPGSGAEEAGIQPCDIIIGVDGKSVENTSADDLSEMIKGEIGTTVVITVKRGDETLDFTVTRKLIENTTVVCKMDEDNIGYIQIIQFLATTPEEFADAVDFCVDNGAVALVIDVRGNPGGLLYSVVSVIDYLVPDADDRVICTLNENAGKEYSITTDGHSVDLPIAVLCNNNTASAGELFTAAMRDFGKEGLLDTVIVGNTTYGKGVAQNSYDLYDLSGITFTIGYFNPPCDVNFNGVGVVPDVEVEKTVGTDSQLEKAIELILELVNKNDSTQVYIGAAA